MKPANALKERKQMNSNTTLLIITIVLFFVLYAAGCVAYASKGFTTVQTFLNVFRSNAGLICVACGMTCVMLTGGIDISVGSLVAMDCMIIAYGLNNWEWASAPTIIALVLLPCSILLAQFGIRALVDVAYRGLGMLRGPVYLAGGLIFAPIRLRQLRRARAEAHEA